MQLTRIAERDGWWCWLCGDAVDPDAIGPWQPTIDHRAKIEVEDQVLVSTSEPVQVHGHR